MTGQSAGGAPLAGEMSGHIFLRDRWHGSDDGVYVALRVLAALGRAGQSLRAFREGLPRTATSPEFRIACPDLRKAEILEAVAASLTGYAVDRTDGLRVSGPDGWWLLRASGTEPKLTARCEAADPDGLSRLQ
ncbi:MAG TPA: phosphomannomutase/phosphoglucomutase, partial [Steroidobacteraceae bacterium]|nr:phosphomannomutase/phosphoglucomutase [Steroidobacteraceae bacterium]